jgi:hypothetical protein
MTYSQALTTAMQHWGENWYKACTIKLAGNGKQFYCSILPPVPSPISRRS